MPPHADPAAFARWKEQRAARKAQIGPREAFFAEARAYTPFLAVDAGDLVFFVSTEDRGVGRRVFARRQRGDMKTLAKAVTTLGELGGGVPQDAVFVDVGANIGTTTATALRRHPFGSAVSLEPSPENFRLLRLNVIANGLDEAVTALPAAASDGEGSVAFDVSGVNRGSHRIAAAPTAETVTVETVTLDALVERGTIDPARTGMIWIDAGGAEDRVLRGARRLVEAGVPVVASFRSNQLEAGGDVAEQLAAGYTDAIELRKQGRRIPIGELPALLAGYGHKGDVLLLRR